jgi:hypothetical protein
MPPSNAAYDMVTIYSPQGDPVTVSRLNAIDLSRTAGYVWHADPDAEAPAPAPEPEPDEDAAVQWDKPFAPHAVQPAAAAPVAIAHPTDAEPAEEPAEEPAPAAEPAKTRDDFDSFDAYLDSLDQPALRALLEEMTGEKVHGRMSKERVIEKIIAATHEEGGAAS